MQFSIKREVFLKSLQRVVGAIEKRHAMPILSNVLLVVKNQLLSLTGTDLEVELISRSKLESPSTPGEITVPAKKLLDICKALPDGVSLDFKVDNSKVCLKSGRSRFILAGLGAEDFPVVEDGPGVLELSLFAGDIRKLMEATSFAMAQQDVRYYLNGLLVDIQPDCLRAVAADGHRLATVAFSPKYQIEKAQSIIIPRKAVLEMQRLFAECQEEVGLVVGENHLRAITTEFSFSTKLVDGKFPDYRRVLPKSQCHHAIIERSMFKQALQRVAVLFSEKYRGAGVHFSSGIMKIVATNSEKDEVEEELEIQYDGPELEIGFNVRYLLEYLNNGQSSKIRMSLIDPNQSVMFESVECSEDLNDSAVSNLSEIYVVMPVRL